MIPAYLDADPRAMVRVPAIRSILEVVSRMTGMGFVAVARVTPSRWIACEVLDTIGFGLGPGGALPVETTLCREIRQQTEPLVINHASQDSRYRAHRTPALYRFESYIATAIMLPDGSFFGTLCALDPAPRVLDTPEIVGAFKLFGELIAFHLDASQKLASSQSDLLREREVAELREQFIAVLGHDLRSPLASVAAGSRMIQRHPDRAVEFAARIDQSLSRMSDLIDDVLDFARGRLGDGLPLSLADDLPLEPVLMQVVQELRSTHPDRGIELACELHRPVRCDHGRVAQVLSNLAANALTHGAADRPVRVAARTEGGMFELSVANAGPAISPETLGRLFQPFFRSSAQPSQEGLGLGLFIASEIARAHHGAIQVLSNNQETRFTFRIPAGDSIPPTERVPRASP